ncbi:MAG TPA: hypothetical protein VFG09_01760, partial [Thermodesulfovibrionales bacterium]|nr:hypothetical protein [Thermodesulfovibrionales bacterium]
MKTRGRPFSDRDTQIAVSTVVFCSTSLTISLTFVCGQGSALPVNGWRRGKRRQQNDQLTDSQREIKT